MLWLPPNPKEDSLILARFAIDEHNKNENALLEFSRAVEMKKDELADGVHHLMVEVIDAGNDKLYEGKVWRKPWMGITELQEFKHVGHSASITADEYGAAWRTVSVDDLEVKEAANHCKNGSICFTGGFDCSTHSLVMNAFSYIWRRQQCIMCEINHSEASLRSSRVMTKRQNHQ